MATYFLDTGILLGYIRGAGYADYVEKHFAVSSPPNIAVISVVTAGEIQSLSLQFRWGDTKRKKLEDLLVKIPWMDINDNRLIEQYAEIDAYSQGKYDRKDTPKVFSPRNMGKNDMWIAATATVLNAILLTTDHDFDHLNPYFLEVKYIDSSKQATDI